MIIVFLDNQTQISAWQSTLRWSVEFSNSITWILWCYQASNNHKWNRSLLKYWLPKFLLLEKEIPRKDHPYFKKWLRYYLDFCVKYQFELLSKKSLSHFIQKLRQKKQSDQQQRQASDAISVFYELGLFNSRNKIARKKDRNHRCRT